MIALYLLVLACIIIVSCGVVAVAIDKSAKQDFISWAIGLTVLVVNQVAAAFYIAGKLIT